MSFTSIMRELPVTLKDEVTSLGMFLPWFATTHLPSSTENAGRPEIVILAAALFSGREVMGAVTTTSSRRSFQTRRVGPKERPLLVSLGAILMRVSILREVTGQRKRRGTERACAPLEEGSIQNVSLPTCTAWGSVV